MGAYTELVMACTFNNLKENETQILMYMCGKTEVEPKIELEAPLFICSRWANMLNSDSYYFDGDTHSEFRRDNISKEHILTVRCNLKNYDSEIKKFLDWVAPKSNSNGFVGYYRHEESESPTLIYFENGKVIIP